MSVRSGNVLHGYKENGVRNFIGFLLDHARRDPARIAFRYLKASHVSEMSRGALVAGACAEAKRLSGGGVNPGDRVLIACKSPQAFTLAFLACLMRGFIAVPLAVPRRKVHRERLLQIVEDSGGSTLLTDDEALIRDPPAGILHVVDLRTEQTISFDDIAETLDCIGLGDVAFLQYTSGSTGLPKGVMVTHENLISNCRTMSLAMDVDERSRILTALPLFHDMGLIGGLLMSIYAGCEASWMEPAELVMFPMRWVKHLSDLGITITGGPNYIYELAVSSLASDDLVGCDLSALRIAFCGAEPVRLPAVLSFLQAYATYGLQSQALYPCYGLAEATLYVAGGSLSLHSKLDSANLSYRLGEGVVVAVVDPDTGLEVSEGVQGEICICSASVAMGYWGRADASHGIFRAEIPGRPGMSFLRTGDLGSVNADGLIVSGRLKDVIILNGRNYAPHDIEHVAAGSHPALDAGGGAAFSLSRGAEGEALVLFHEVRRQWLKSSGDEKKIVASVRSALLSDMGIVVSEIVLLRTGSLPRTSSGKVRRSACREMYMTLQTQNALLAAV